MRTTLTLDDDVAAKLNAEMRRSGKSFKETVNDALQRALLTKTMRSTNPFRVETRDLGESRPGLSLDNIAELMDQLEGSGHR
jgi:predicted phage gp36 major capsid-like protein